MKKLIATVALIATVGFFGVQQASAQKGMGGGGGTPFPDCWRANQQNAQVLDEESQKARTAFMDSTTELRKGMFMKRAEMRAIMHGDNPDEKKAAALAGELFDLRTKIQEKADEAGWKGGMGGGAGMGCDKGCNGSGGGKGMGCDKGRNGSGSGKGHHMGGGGHMMH